jgi:hypothetical protein
MSLRSNMLIVFWMVTGKNLYGFDVLEVFNCMLGLP